MTPDDLVVLPGAPVVIPEFHGLLPSLPDPRRYIYGATLIPKAIPPKYDLLQWDDPIYSQSGGSCAPNASVGARANVARRLGADTLDHSRLYVYAHARGSGPSLSDTGSYLSSCMDALKKFGTPREATWPESSGVNTYPPASLDAEAANYEIKQYAYISPLTVDAVKLALSNNLPVVLGMVLHQSFRSPVNGVIPMPTTDGTWGAHAVTAVGWDDAKLSVEGVPGCFLFRNSWGTGWGLSGYAWLPYDFLGKYVFEGWTISDVAIPPAPVSYPVTPDQIAQLQSIWTQSMSLTITQDQWNTVNAVLQAIAGQPAPAPTPTPPPAPTPSGNVAVPPAGQGMGNTIVDQYGNSWCIKREDIYLIPLANGVQFKGYSAAAQITYTPNDDPALATVVIQFTNSSRAQVVFTSGKPTGTFYLK
jgi:hypothetical protein